MSCYAILLHAHCTHTARTLHARTQLAGSGGGILTTVASFGGALSYKIGLFDVAKVSLVLTLTSTPG